MKKMTERKRAREEEELQLQSCHVWPVSDFLFFIFCMCTRVSTNESVWSF